MFKKYCVQEILVSLPSCGKGWVREEEGPNARGESAESPGAPSDPTFLPRARGCSVSSLGLPFLSPHAHPNEPHHVTLMEANLPQLGPVATHRDKWPAILLDAGRWLASSRVIVLRVTESLRGRRATGLKVGLQLLAYSFP